MVYRIGIIGATGPVNRIMSISESFKDGISFLPLPFENENEIQDLLHKNKKKVDGWLFSGPLPYNLAKKYLSTKDNVTYCKSTGAGFYINCLQIAYEHNTNLPKVSIDMFESLMDIEMTVAEMNIPMDQVYIKYYGEGYSLEEIFQFHLNLWKKGSINGAITAFSTVFNKLKKHNVPAYHLVLTKQEIYQSLKIITEKVKTSYFKTTQVGSVIIAINNYDELIEKSKSMSLLQTFEWKLQGVLLPLCNNLDGHLIAKGNGAYEIFSSRGAIEKELNTLYDTIRQMSIAINFDFSVNAGIGYGETVSQAEFNAYKALRNNKNSNDITIIKNDGELLEFYGQKEKISYDYFSNDQELLNKLHQAGVSIKTFKKIYATLVNMQKETFTVLQLATQLSVTEQNIRRILSALTKVNLVTIVGEENSSNKGRPGKIYKLNF